MGIRGTSVDKGDRLSNIFVNEYKSSGAKLQNGSQFRLRSEPGADEVMSLPAALS